MPTNDTPITRTKQCLLCGATYSQKPTQSRKNWNERSKFCSQTCVAKFYKNGSETTFKKGHTPWTAGLGGTGRVKAWNKKYTPEQLKEKKKQWSRESYLRYKTKHPKEERQKRVKEWLDKNPQKAKEIQKRGYLNHKDRYKKHTFLRKQRENYNGGHFSNEEWATVVARYGSTCLRCGSTGDMTIDHVIPIALGGSNSIDNIQPLCRSCNCSKGAKHIDYRKID